jgi:chaperonin GroES
MNLRPILDKIIVKPQNAETETKGGIILANAKNEGIIKGTILAVGKGKYDDKGNFISVEVPVGAEILFNKGAGTSFKHEEEEFITLTENEIIAVLS